MKLKSEYKGQTITTYNPNKRYLTDELTKLDVYNLSLQGIDVSYMFEEEKKKRTKKYKALDERRTVESPLDEQDNERD